MSKEHDIEKRRYDFGLEISKPMTEKAAALHLLRTRQLYIENWLLEQGRLSEALQYPETRDPELEKEADFQRQNTPFSTEMGTIFMFSVPESHDPLIAQGVINFLTPKSITE